MVHVQFLPLGSCDSSVLFSMGGVYFLSFFVWKLQVVSPLKLIFLVGPSFIARSVCNHGALKSRLHVAALPASLAMSWPGEFTKLEQVRTWLLSSSLAEFQQFYSEWFFSNLLQYISSWLHGSCSVFAFRVLWFFCFVLHTMTGIFCFLVWKFQTVPR